MIDKPIIIDNEDDINKIRDTAQAIRMLGVNLKDVNIKNSLVSHFQRDKFLGVLVCLDSICDELNLIDWNHMHLKRIGKLVIKEQENTTSNKGE